MLQLVFVRKAGSGGVCVYIKRVLHLTAKEMSFISECTYIITSFILYVQRHVFKGFVNVFSQDVINVI